MINLVKSLFDGSNLKKYDRALKQIEDLAPTINVLTEAEIKAKTADWKTQIKEGKLTLDQVTPEAFALVREAATRTLGQRHYRVQLLGGLIINSGAIAEMRTGEGKTLVATLPAYLNALTGDGVHVVTVNDYLARRDAAWMGQVYAYAGLSVSVINHDASYIYDPSHKENDENKEEQRDEQASYKVVYEFLRPCSRHEAYKADIVYGTNSEFGFDYLRDNIEYDEKRIRQGVHAYAIVDEVDSILIDEARTPLIISAPANNSEDLYGQFATVARKLVKDTDYTVDEKFRSISMTDIGIGKVEKILNVENLYTDKGVKFVHHLETAVRAEALYKPDRDYVVKEGEVVIVDTFTGRLQPGRRWSEGLHQAVEAKEGVMVQRESRTYASITYQNYFKLYKKLSGMTGTALTSKEEFQKVYGLDTILVPTHRGNARIDKPDLVFQNEQGKYKALAHKVKELQLKGQPVLIGTVSIEKNEMLSAFLNQAGVKHQMLNAKNHEKEGEIVALAGKRGAVTVATNMAGRGVDIKLGGPQATPEESEEVKSLGGLYVVGTERHEARRIDNQLRGRSGRQGDPGETQFYVSLEDDLMRIFASGMVKSMMGKLGIPEDQPIENSLVSRSIESAQKKIEGFHFDSRKHVLDFDNVLNFQRKFVYERRRKVLFADPEHLEYEISQILAESDIATTEIINKKIEGVGREEFMKVFRRMILQSIDTFWIEHLEVMDHLRGSVNLRAYGQRDPLTEYKREGLRLFKEMEQAVSHEITSLVPNIQVNAFEQEEQRMKKEIAEIQNTKDEVEKSEVNIDRNSPCPCGSGKKWKKCGYLNTPEHEKRSNS